MDGRQRGRAFREHARRAAGARATMARQRPGPRRKRDQAGGPRHGWRKKTGEPWKATALAMSRVLAQAGFYGCLRDLAFRSPTLIGNPTADPLGVPEGRTIGFDFHALRCTLRIARPQGRTNDQIGLHYYAIRCQFSVLLASLLGYSAKVGLVLIRAYLEPYFLCGLYSECHNGSWRSVFSRIAQPVSRPYNLRSIPLHATVCPYSLS